MTTYTAPMPRTMFGAASLLRVDISAAPLAADSPRLVAALGAQVAELYGGTAAFNAHSYGAAVHVVGPTTPRRTVTFRDAQGKGYTPTEFKPGGVLASVPIPDDATPAPGTDGHLAVFDTSSSTLWELWQARRDSAGQWSAVWGGRIDDTTTSTGFFTPYTGVSASGVAQPAVAVGVEEVRAGAIEHAVGIGVSRVAKGPCYPANRDDGNSTAPDALHEGQRFRLRADVDIAALRRPRTWAGAQPQNLTRTCALIAAAAKRYGLIVVDRSGGVSVTAELAQQTRAATGVDPWVEINGRGVPDYLVLEGFPWQALEALPFDYGKPTPPTTTPNTAQTTKAGGTR